jgi:hypothetical protein
MTDSKWFYVEPITDRTSAHNMQRFQQALDDDPRRLAEQVLAACRGDLGLPTETRVEFLDLEDWGEWDPSTPRVVKLSVQLLEPEYQHLIPYVVGHEARHCSINLRARAGTVPTTYALDADLNERLADVYGETIAQRWRSR